MIRTDSGFDRRLILPATTTPRKFIIERKLIFHSTAPTLAIFSSVDKYQSVHKGLEVIITSDLVWLAAEKENVLKACQRGRIYIVQASWGFWTSKFQVLVDSISCFGFYCNFLWFQYISLTAIWLPMFKGKIVTSQAFLHFAGCIHIPNVFNLQGWSQNARH